MPNLFPLRTACELRLLLPAAYQKPIESKTSSAQLIMFPCRLQTHSGPRAIAPPPAEPAPKPVSVAERAAWKERALISQEYARILKRGGNLSI